MASQPTFAIVGAGVIGLACAWCLAQAGVAVHVYDMRTAGQGATLAALGALWPASPLAQGPLQNLHRASLWEFERFVWELTAQTGTPITFRRNGRLEILNSAKAVARAHEEAAVACAAWPAFSDGPVRQVLPPAEIARRWPQLAPAEFGGTLCRATAQVKVAELVAALRAACVAAGVVLHEATPVVALERRGDRLVGVRTAEGIRAADGVLVAAGAWSPLLEPFVTQVAPIRPVKGQGIALTKPKDWEVEMIVKKEKIYVMPWEQELLVGSTTEPEAGFDEKPTDAGRSFLCAGAAGIMPGLRDAAVLRHWAGLRPQNPAKRHPPIMGRHPEIGNLYVCTGHFKTGIGLAPRVSKLMASMILEGETPGELGVFWPRIK